MNKVWQSTAMSDDDEDNYDVAAYSLLPAMTLLKYVRRVRIRVVVCVSVRGDSVVDLEMGDRGQLAWAGSGRRLRSECQEQRTVVAQMSALAAAAAASASAAFCALGLCMGFTVHVWDRSRRVCLRQTQGSCLHDVLI